jgi:predicted nucleic acid-binding protein
VGDERGGFLGRPSPPRRLKNQVHDLIAPDCFPLEAAHALSKAERRGIIRDAAQLWLELMADSPQLFPSAPLMLRALSIATRARIGVYDCLYVALAEREGCELVTANARLLNSLQPTYPFIITMAAVP